MVLLFCFYHLLLLIGTVNALRKVSIGLDQDVGDDAVGYQGYNDRQYYSMNNFDADNEQLVGDSLTNGEGDNDDNDHLSRSLQEDNWLDEFLSHTSTRAYPTHRRSKYYDRQHKKRKKRIKKIRIKRIRRKKKKQKANKSHKYNRRVIDEIDEMKLEAEEERIPETPAFIEETTTERIVSLDPIYDRETGNGYSTEDLDRKCEETKSIGRTFGITNISNFAGSNCGLIQLYYTDISCSQIQQFVEIMSQHQATQQFYQILNICSNSMYSVRKLRGKVLSLHEKLLPTEEGKPSIDKMSEEEKTKLAKEVDNMCKDLRDTYDNLESMSRQLPNEMPSLESLIRLKNIYAIEHSQELTDNPTLMIENMINSLNWNEANYQMYQYLAELGAIANRSTLSLLHRKRTSQMLPRPVQFTTKDSAVSCHQAHHAFESAYAHFKKEIQSKNIGLHTRELEKTPLSSLIEFKSHVSADKQIVFMLKFLFVISYGNIEQVIIIAPHEEWKYIEDGGQKRLDMRQQSRYEVYRRISNSANHVIATYIYNWSSGSPIFRWTQQSLQQIIIMCTKFKEIFDAKCRICRKTMKDFLPPTVILFELRNTKDIFAHETCK
ncbi:hypothetical protein WR25_11465 [Diploscapter pachys]|uniref:aECM cysteine-cradle domain-containing protein n=1 Tax=Diploscapter pachys TaxID=2018661 RepID=A0A2A2J6I1_9BILA|nr:hypothetical protein WR25_11465 [Diploscapter pachys]